MIPRIASWIVGLLLPKADSEALLGDLAEEYAQRRGNVTRPNETVWYWIQIARSLSPLALAAAKRQRWLGALGAAVAIYVLISWAETYTNSIMSWLFGPSGVAFMIGSLAFSPLTMAVGGYAAARIRRGAAAVLAIISAIAIIRLMVLTGNPVAIAYLTGFLIVCPLTALAGGALVHRRARVR
jgi:hypothetical protein